jgi:hypothetical protein
MDDDYQKQGCFGSLLAYLAPGSAPTRALTGFLTLRCITGLIISHAGVIFAGVLVFEALKITDCVSEGDGDHTCNNNGHDSEDDDNEEKCRRLWGLLKPGALLTTIGTCAAVTRIFSSAFFGAVMDFTPYRKQMTELAACVCVAGVMMCSAIVDPTEVTIFVCSIGYFFINVFGDVITISTESYAPELSKDVVEVASAVSGGGTWVYVSEITSIAFFTVATIKPLVQSYLNSSCVFL